MLRSSKRMERLEARSELVIAAPSLALKGNNRNSELLSARRKGGRSNLSLPSHLPATLRFVTFASVSLVFVTIGLEICDFCRRPALIFVTLNLEICDLCTFLQGPRQALKIVTF